MYKSRNLSLKHSRIGRRQNDLRLLLLPIKCDRPIDSIPFKFIRVRGLGELEIGTLPSNQFQVPHEDLDIGLYLLGPSQRSKFFSALLALQPDVFAQVRENEPLISTEVHCTVAQSVQM
jgi:hypothetical protein